MDKVHRGQQALGAGGHGDYFGLHAPVMAEAAQAGFTLRDW